MVSGENLESLKILNEDILSLHGPLMKQDAKLITEHLKKIDASIKNVNEPSASLSKSLVGVFKVSEHFGHYDGKTSIEKLNLITSNLIREWALVINNEAFVDFQSKTFVFFCPMANDNQGGFWLQNNDEIVNNPYLNEEMPTCGEQISWASVKSVLGDK